MSRNSIAACILSVAFAGISNAQSVAPFSNTGAQPSQAQVKKMVRTARVPEQYKSLANYYDEQRTAYLERAAEEKTEVERRSEHYTGIFAKYPSPVDSSRNLYEYYIFKASESGSMESKYTRVAAIDSPVNAQ